MTGSTPEMVKVSQNPSQEENDERKTENQYSIFEYFKEHTGFFVACISGLVAIISFVLSYGIVRYHSAFLSYWNINTMYADQVPGAHLYTFSYILVYSMAILIVHVFLAKTSQVFAHYNKCLSLLRQERKRIVRHHRAINAQDKSYEQLLESLPDHYKDSKRIQQLGVDLMNMKDDVKAMLSPNDILEECRRELRGYTLWNILWSIFLSYLTLVLTFFLVPDTYTLQTVASITKTAAIIVILDTLVYFIPTYIGSRFSQKQLKEIGFSEALNDLMPLSTDKFPLIKLLVSKPKELLSNRSILLFITHICVTMIIMLFACTIGGRQNAYDYKKFPILTCEGKTYAIVYINGTTAFAQEASFEGTSITINTARQKVMSSQNITFQICEFDKVTKLDVTETGYSQVDLHSDSCLIPEKGE